MPETNTNPTLCLYCWDNTEWLDTTYAVIDITPEWAQTMCGLVQQMAALRSASQPSRRLYQMEYWDWTPTWVIRPGDGTDGEGLVEALCDDIEAHQAVYLAAGASPWHRMENDRQSVECVTLRVQEDGISWAAHIKHAEDARLSTETISLKDLAHYAKGEEPTGASVITYEPDEEGEKS